MADLAVTVDTDGGGDYSSLSAAQTGELVSNSDLAGDNNTMTFDCEGSATDNTALDLTGWTVSATYNITINATEKHDGTRSSGYYFDGATSWIHGMNIQEAYTVIKGLIIANTNANAGSAIGINADDCEIIDCLIVDTPTYSGGAGGIVCNNGGTIIVNTFIFNCNKGIYCGSGITNIYYCTILNSAEDGIDVKDYRTCVLKNSYVGLSTNEDLADDGGNGIYTITTSRTEDGSESTSTVSIANCGFTSSTSGSEDAHISSGSSLRGLGTDLSADATYAVDIDFEGDDRSSSRDLGADEYVSGGTIYDMSATGEIAVEGSAGISALNNISCSGEIAVAGSADITSLISLTGAGEIGVEGQAGISNLISLAGSGEIAVEGSANIVAIISASATGEVAIEGTAALNGIFGMSAAAEIGVEGQAFLNMIATMAANGEIAVAGSGDLTFVGVDEFNNVSFFTVTKKGDILDTQNKKTDILTESLKHGDILPTVKREGH